MNKKLLVLFLSLSAAAAGCSDTAEQLNAEQRTDTRPEETAEPAVALADTEKEQQKAEQDNADISSAEKSGIELTHIHGLGITEDSEGIYVASHNGLKTFENGTWSRGAGAPHDYMGFSVVDDGFYSSGHPAEKSDLADPFGIVHSGDMGESLELLGLDEEVDFHLMAAGYRSHALYVVNPQQNTRMDVAGIFYSVNDAKSWTQSAAEGLSGRLLSIAAHPDEEGVVAIGTDKGLFLSENYGKTFEPVGEVPVTSVAFSADGRLFAGSTAEEPVITAYHLGSGKETIFQVPELEKKGTIIYLAAGEADEGHLLFSTSAKDIYMTEDNGETWIQITDDGKALNLR